MKNITKSVEVLSRVIDVLLGSDAATEEQNQFTTLNHISCCKPFQALLWGTYPRDPHHSEVNPA